MKIGIVEPHSLFYVLGKRPERSSGADAPPYMNVAAAHAVEFGLRKRTNIYGLFSFSSGIDLFAHCSFGLRGARCPSAALVAHARLLGSDADHKIREFAAAQGVKAGTKNWSTLGNSFLRSMAKGPSRRGGRGPTRMRPPEVGPYAGRSRRE